MDWHGNLASYHICEQTFGLRLLLYVTELVNMIITVNCVVSFEPVGYNDGLKVMIDSVVSHGC